MHGSTGQLDKEANLWHISQNAAALTAVSYTHLHDAEQRKIRLRHKAELVAVFVDLILHRPLRQTQKIHVAEFGQQNIVDQLRKIAAQHVLLLKAHRIGPAQTDGAAIEIEHPLSLIHI